MGKALLDISMSLDGFITGANDNAEQPLGRGGQRLHDWIWNSNDDALAQLRKDTGAIVSGRRTYDLVNGWDGCHPIHGVPVFVVTHHVPEKVPQGATSFTFVTDGAESALEQAQVAAGGKNIYVMGGASIAQQLIKAKLLDELNIHIAPVLLGDGVRLFDNLDDEQFVFKQTQVVDSSGVTHLHLQVIK